MLRVALCAAVVAAAACGAPPHSGATPRERNVLTHDEIVREARDGTDLYEAVQALRPSFLQPPLGVQRASAPQGTVVYINRRLQGGLEALRTILAGNVEEVRYLGPTQSQNELGPEASSGALMITLRKPSADTAAISTFQGMPVRR